MAITIKESSSPARAGGQIKRSNASLVGAFVIGIGIFVLWMLIATQLGYAATSPPVLIGGLVVAAALGGWVRLADL